MNCDKSFYLVTFFVFKFTLATKNSYNLGGKTFIQSCNTDRCGFEEWLANSRTTFAPYCGATHFGL